MQPVTRGQLSSLDLSFDGEFGATVLIDGPEDWTQTSFGLPKHILGQTIGFSVSAGPFLDRDHNAVALTPPGSVVCGLLGIWWAGIVHMHKPSTELGDEGRTAERRSKHERVETAQPVPAPRYTQEPVSVESRSVPQRF